MKLSNELYEKVWSLVEKSQKNFSENDYKNAFTLLDEAWNLLPEPKEQCDESFLIVRWFIKTAIQASSVEMMEKWAPKILIADLERLDSGEREAWYGKVAYELGDYNSAEKYLKIARKKSKGRCFDANDQKYIDFIIKKA